MSELLLTNIGLLATNDPNLGTGLLGQLADAELLACDGQIVWVGPRGEAPGPQSELREVVDADGGTVFPGFVDSHSHLVFGGERSAEFRARMTGEPYRAGGIRRTVQATREASDSQLRRRVGRFIAEMQQQGTTTVEIKSGYGLSVEDETRSVRIARDFTSEVTFLGAHVVPEEYAGRADDYMDLVVDQMLPACRPYCRWVDVFCETGAFTPQQARRVLEAGRQQGLGLKLHANQLGHGPGVQLAVELGAASVDHCTYISQEDIEALAGSDTVCTLLPGVEFSTRQPYVDARELFSAGVTVALASDCNPGSCFTSSLPLMVALAVREMRFTPEQALWSATRGGALALRRDDVGWLRPGSRANLVLLDAPSPIYLAYRPGVPLISRVWEDGKLVARNR